ncbi:FGGY-family carbohydrate kinase [Lachnospiraceae bacterium 38-10]
MNTLVIDVGTSSIRGVLYNKLGETLFCHQIGYQVHYFGEGFAEQDPEDWSHTLIKICRETSAFCLEHRLRVDALALTCQRSSIIPVGKDGVPLRPAIMWQDKRNADIAAEFAPHMAFVNSLTGARINTVFSGTKMTWLKRNEPEIYDHAEKICTIADYIVYQITGLFRTDHTYGSRSLLMNIRTRCWDEELLKLFEVAPGKLCDLVQPGSCIGTVTKSFAGLTGIPDGIPLISAGGDQQCSALGHGVTRAKTMELTTGTGAFLLGCCDNIPEHLSDNIICGAHAIPGKYVLESSILACAAMYNWMKGILFPEDESFEAINESVMRSPAGSNGVLVLPYFQGRGTPDWNNKASGSFANLNLGTTRDDMARAVLEGIACETGINLNILQDYMGRAEQIFIGGGLTKFRAFNQIQADVYQHELLRNRDNAEQTAFGAWISAAVTLGLYDSYDKAMSHIRQKSRYEQYLPDENTRDIYAERQKAMAEYYKKMYSQ